MIPTNSSGTTNGCDNISSNCVIWQGPDIECIDLCTGDTISEVVYKLATKVCDIITNGVTANPSLTGLDLACLNISGVTPTTLVPVLQAMVTQICANSSSSISSFTSGGGSSSSLPIMTLPACLQYNDASGNPVTELPLDQFATLIANQVCDNLSSINIINSTLTSFNTRIDILEACVLPCSGTVAEVQIVPTCVSNVGTLTNVSVVVLALESAFCALSTAVGTIGAINNAISQTIITGSYTTLTNNSVSYGSIGGWNSSPTTLAQSVQNAWVVIDDMYTAITNIQDECCPGGCDSVVFAYTTAVGYDSNGLIDGILFNFTGSSVPAGFNDCSGYSNITVTDGLGSSLTQTVSVSSLQNNSSGFNFLTGALNTQQNMSVSVDFCVTDGVDTCQATQGSTITGFIPCPSSVTIGTLTTTGMTATITNLLGTNATYLLEVIDAGNVVIETYTITSPGPIITQAFTSLVPTTTYNLRITVTYGGVTKVCDLVPFTTVTGAAPCDEGMDVIFVLDYSSSMSGATSGVQAGVASLVNTIDTSSGANDYRLALVTADEMTSATPNYGACADYISLPAAQKVANGPGPMFTYQITTAWEMFQNNNGATFTTQLNKLNTGVDGTCIQMGNGIGVPEPTDTAAMLCTGPTELVGAFRTAVAKYVIIITDALPGGDQEAFNSIVWANINSMITQANLAGIKYFICGPGVNIQGSGALAGIYPWQELANQTGGGYNASYAASSISADIIAGCS